MSTIKKFEDQEIWQIAEKPPLRIFTASTDGAFLKDFRFRDQIRAASGSIMDNIAEGFERSSRLEFINFPGFAKGSCGAVQSQLHRAKNRLYITERFLRSCMRAMTGFLQLLQALWVISTKHR
ncbi:four helix bundle protein [Niabella aurantiaca]|uniref:four helix bundle protein n=1 Tax=Niabella aurantiaca TaxID=379900 RepID=UPI00039FE394|nr:four helix bundle protein [Niabella aurantiaca]